jgi:phosphoribosylanthranilate isomerase
MTDTAAVSAALAANVDAIGFVFAPSSRRVRPLEAAELAAPARGRCAIVAVTLHPTQQWLDEIVRDFAPDILQTDWVDLPSLQLPESLPTLPVLRDAVTGNLPARVLFEGHTSGSGQSADWAQAGQLARRTELILAGGLKPRTVAAAVASVLPFGVDVSSGVESTPGHKSPELIADFVHAARAAARELP